MCVSTVTKCNIYCSFILVLTPQVCFHLQPETEGYLAVVLPKLTENILDGHLTKEEYDKLLEDRKSSNGTSEL